MTPLLCYSFTLLSLSLLVADGALAVFSTGNFRFVVFPTFSLAVSVKMNILLFAPALFLLMLKELGAMRTFQNIFICGLLQV